MGWKSVPLEPAYAVQRERRLVWEILYIVAVKLRSILLLRVISLGFKISDLCCEQKVVDYFIPLSIQEKATMDLLALQGHI